MKRQKGIWITAVLLALGAPRTKENYKFMWGWWLWESGGHGPYGTTYPSAKFNWLNTMRPAIGATDYNSIGVKNYPTWIQGVKSTVSTLKRPVYLDILRALRSGNPFDHPPLEGLSTWLSGTPSSDNGIAYARSVINTGRGWIL